MNLEALSVYGNSYDRSYFLHYDDPSCQLVRVDTVRDSIKYIVVITDKKIWFDMLRKNNIIGPRQRTITYKQFQKMLVMYKIMGFEVNSIE